MAALAKFNGWIWEGVGIGKFLIGLGVRIIRDPIITWFGYVLTYGWLAVSLY